MKVLPPSAQRRKKRNLSHLGALGVLSVAKIRKPAVEYASDPT
jgi:hypothetical protein